MKVFSWNAGRVTAGVEVRADERLGPVVFLGEEGRGRHYEKVALAKRNPAEVIGGRVLEARVQKITLPATGGKLEKSFFVLESSRTPADGVLVRICTHTSYVRNGSGKWQVIAGKPETVVSGYGAFGDAGRIGNWDDGLVVMRPGDVLRVYPSRGDSSALWLGEDMAPVTATWQDYQNIAAVAAAQAVVAEAKTAALDIAFGQMPAFSWKSGALRKGITVSAGATGPVVSVGEKGRGRSLVEVPLIGLKPADEVLDVAVAKLSEKVWGLTTSATHDEGILVRVNSSGGYTRRGNGKVEVWKGTPKLIAQGNGADGDAGNIGSWDDEIWVLREGDVLFARPSGGNPAHAIYVAEGEIQTRLWAEWKLADAMSDPAFYVGKGTAPWGHAPAQWLGKVVTVQDKERNDLETGELVSVNPLLLNLGWDGRDYAPKTVAQGGWVIVEENKKVRKLEGEAAEKRRQLRDEAQKLQAEAVTAWQKSYFALAESGLRREMQALVEAKGFESMPTEGWRESLTSWVEMARGVLAKFAAIEPELKTLEERQGSGEVSVDFGGHYRRMGNTGNADFWVVRADGSLREPNEVSYRGRYTSEGRKTWRIVAAEELAISWSKACTAADHEFVVNKLPVSGCTQAQLETVRRLEQEISQQWASARGMHGTTSPEAQGWQELFRDEQELQVVEEEAPPTAPASRNALAALAARFQK